MISFIRRCHFYYPKPTKGYLYNCGVQEAFCTYKPIIDPQAYLEQLVAENLSRLKDAAFLIGIIWGDQKVKVADIFGYANVKLWPGNPEVSNWVFRDGVYQPTPQFITCANSIRMLGLEENARRGTKSLEEYMELKPFLADLQPFND